MSNNLYSKKRLWETSLETSSQLIKKYNLQKEDERWKKISLRILKIPRSYKEHITSIKDNIKSANQHLTKDHPPLDIIKDRITLAEKLLNKNNHSLLKNDYSQLSNDWKLVNTAYKNKEVAIMKTLIDAFTTLDSNIDKAKILVRKNGVSAPEKLKNNKDLNIVLKENLERKIHEINKEFKKYNSKLINSKLNILSAGYPKKAEYCHNDDETKIRHKHLLDNRFLQHYSSDIKGEGC